MPTKTPTPTALSRAEWTALATLAILAVLAGVWPVTGELTTWAPALAVPAAAGLPFLIPPLRLMPLGETTWSFWAADSVAAVIMLVTAWAWLRAAARRRPHPGPGRAFARGLWATVVAVVFGNLVRTVFLSFVTNADLGTYLGYAAFGIVVSLITGVVLGLVVGGAAAVAASLRTTAPSPA